MEEGLVRAGLLLGEEGLRTLGEARVAVFGIGGVGSYAVEALCRSGVGNLLLVDHDVVAESNINRQLHADRTTIGQHKTLLMAARGLRIRPETRVETREVFCTPDNVGEVLRGDFDYIVDAVDNVSAKIALVLLGWERGIPVISCMGAGNKLDPTRMRVSDLYETTACPLCRVMRRELRRRGVEALKVVWSDEPPLTPLYGEEGKPGRNAPGSVAFVPPVAGLIAAGEVVRDLCGISR